MERWVDLWRIALDDAIKTAHPRYRIVDEGLIDFVCGDQLRTRQRVPVDQIDREKNCVFA
ncbi:MAG: hypothetical protein ACI9MB_003555, partial [Verrucomicrobiales bacterium]